MHEDLDDTVLGTPHPRRVDASSFDEDTIVPKKPLVSERAEGKPPALVDPVTPTKQRRVPLTNQRVQESVKTAPSRPSGASVASALLAVQIPVRTEARSAAHSFRVGDRLPISLDIPALVGRHPAAPRVPGRELPRLVRVSSPLSEVSGTHVELRQDGTSVVVTDLRSTNGTIVRMPGARPLKLRQGESVVVRPGTLVDIGDGNVLEILPPPRLAVPGDPTDRRSKR
ncbi:MAG: FHA domain-containing protein [Lacisediminihabitans sp.]